MLLSKNTFAFIIFVMFLGCNNIESQSTQDMSHKNDQFDKYWYDGTAELTRYELKQSRYGEVHTGDAVLIFVTEEFRTDKQVKYEGGDRKNVVPILKLNLTKKFITGVYPYSLMTSIFTPIDVNDKTIKISTSSQEWCGHTFGQLNREGDGYRSRLFSYFQSENDQDYKIKDAITEDGLWTTLRMSPDALPAGDIDIIPGTQYLMLTHTPAKKASATATKKAHQDESLSDKLLTKYTLQYNNLDRILDIVYESEFPYNIVAWEERSKSGNSPATTARMTNQIKSPYWGKHDNKDRALRKELGL
ncbi:hypothetical protein N9L92_05475 [Saprospiraceae bacterium]|nr:hypothetical protein [Saprospiraceae bacterium]